MGKVKSVLLIFFILYLMNILSISVISQEVEAPQEKEDDKRGGKSNRVQVGIPFIFGMDLIRAKNDTGRNDSATGIDLGVLGGLVRFSMDRTRDANGNRVGPISVSIFGQKVAGRRRR